MAQHRVSLWFFFVAGLFAGVSIYAAVQGRVNAVFIGVAGVFFVLALAARRKEGGPNDSAGA